VLATIGLAIVLINALFASNEHGASSPSQQNVPAISTEIESTWRYTAEGWQDASTWQVPESFVPMQTFELVHPFVWAAIVLLAVIAAMIWASNESEIADLFFREDNSIGDGHAPND